MTEKSLPTFDSMDEPESPGQQLRGEAVATETIDITSWLTKDVYSSGSFDLSSVGSTSFGRLLDALPMPAILIDQWYTVGFANHSCSRISQDYKKVQGVQFLDLMPRPADSGTAKALAEKTQSLMESVFITRKSRVVEAILEIHKNRVWTRLHLRPVRIGCDRHVLVLIEDLTKEKTQLELSRRQEKESARQHGDMERQLQASNSELSTITGCLGLETANHLRTQQALRVEKRKFKMLWDKAPLACALVSPSGAFHKINRHFTEMFGYDLGDLPNLRDWIIRAWSDAIAGQLTGAEWLNALNQSNGKQVASATVAVTCKDGTTRDISLSGAKLDDGHCFIICLCSQEHQREVTPE